MSWALIILAVVLIGIGAEALVLSRFRVRLPQQEIDKLVYGDPPPPLSDASREYMERRVVVRNGLSTHVLGIMFVSLGLLLGAAGFGWL